MPGPDVIVPFIIFMIPIVAILTKHQQKMAEIIHQNQANRNLPNPEIDALRREVSELRQLVHQQTINIDNLTSVRPQAPSEDLRTNLGA